MSDFVEIFEVGPRDGLQNEPAQIATDAKIAFVDLLSTVGFRRIEVASFVSPKWVPQMADSDQVMAGITRAPGISYTALTPNMKGLARATTARADAVAIFGAASESFSKANLNATIDESLQTFKEVAQAAKQAGISVRGYVSCVTDCPYEGEINPNTVLKVAQKLEQMGCHEISLGDTIGRGKPERVAKMLEAITNHIPTTKLAGHFHDTDGRALENIEVALNYGLRVFDAAVGGLGGCPYAPGAAGNVATEKVHQHLVDRGFNTGLDLHRLLQVGKMALKLREGQKF